MDCTKTAVYLTERKRMTNNCAIPCGKCPLSSNITGKDILCTHLEYEYPEKAIAIVDAWSKEHPIKTFKDVFLTQHPNAPVDKHGYPSTLPWLIYGNLPCFKQLSCIDAWDLPFEE